MQLQLEVRSHYMSGVDLSPAKKVMAVTSICAEQFVAWEVRSNTSHALQVQNSLQVGNISTHRDF
jgi:hypothetical protein